MHEPQLGVPPHPSEIVPQFLVPQAWGVQPQTLAVPPPPQVWLAGQVLPQLSIRPHPSGIMPQSLCWAAQVVGVQPQTLGVPAPPQVWGGVHIPALPQVSVLPQPSGMVPQFLP
jgi:hypothetical protein